MDIWSEIREQYARGGITQHELAEKYDVPLGSLRRRAAKEGWSRLREQRRSSTTTSDSSAKHTRISMQLAVTDRLLEIIAGALEKEDELYYHVAFAKSSDGSEFVAQRLPMLNDERLGRIVKALSDIFTLQRMVLGIHDYKDELSALKIEKDSHLASRKLELELLKIENSQGAPDTAPDGFLAALGLAEGDEEYGKSA
ncbi:MAG: hypothetical protein IJC18_03795 [Clostridia bacterium]|nr:hypothetical protein [Clostridia bacterium]